MSTPEESGEALRHATKVINLVRDIEDASDQADCAESMHEATRKAIRALSPESVTAALRDEDATHITARMDLLVAICNELHVSSAHLVELAEKLRAASRDLAEAIERPDDSDL